MAKLEQLASDALITPKWVLPGSVSTSSRHSAGIFGRPGPRRRPNAAQRRWTSARCQPRTVAGCSKSRTPADSLRPRAATIRRSAVRQRARSGASEDEELLADDEEFEIAIGSTAAAEGEEVDQEAKEGIEEC